MSPKSTFWLTLEQLADDLQREGSTDDERASVLIPVLEATSASVLTTHLENLSAVTSSLNYLLARCKVR